MQKITAVLGDDLTGCMDTGVFLDKKGIRTKVFFGNDFNIAAHDTAALVFDLETRNALPRFAYQKVINTVKLIKDKGYWIKYFKIDSTLRGSIGSQIKALIDTGIYDVVVFAPALPKSKRTTRNGIHYVEDIPVADTDIGKDPFSPVLSSFLPDLFDKDLTTEVLGLDIVAKGSDAVSKEIAYMKKKGINVICADAATDADLCTLAESISFLDHSFLACGSAGFFEALMDTLDDVNRPFSTMSHIPLLTVSGSPAKISREQIKKATDEGIKCLRIDIGENIHDGLVDFAAGHLKKGMDLIIDAAGEGKNEIALNYAGNNDLMEKDAIIIKETLSDFVRGLLQKDICFSLMVFGGDTAHAIFRKLGASQILITGQIEPLVPLGEIDTDMDKRQTIVTKAGGFGSEDVIMKTIKHLRG